MLTVYGIETRYTAPLSPKRTNLLQQCLPFTVLKRNDFHNRAKSKSMLQQCLPFTVLKRVISLETPPARLSCNSAYRLRYWNRLQDVVSYADERLKLQQYLPFTVLKLNGTLATSIKLKVATALTIYGVCWRIWGTREVAQWWDPHVAYLNEVKVKQRW